MRDYTYVILFFLLVTCCSKEDLTAANIDVFVDKEEIEVNIDSCIYDSLYREGVKAALLKADQIVNTKWTAMGFIPNTLHPEKPYTPNTTYKGIPYSSVKEEDKFVGIDVSFYTFLTAASNPRSVLYTDFVNKPPYHGKNCAPYYGIVCSTSVGYAIGLDIPYPSRDFSSHPDMVKITDDDLDLVEPGVILASKGHTIMVVSVEKEEDLVKKVKFLENSHYLTLTRDKLRNFWHGGNYSAYKYKKLIDNKYSEIEYPYGKMSLTVNRGDKAAYREGEDVVINVFESKYDSMIIIKDGRFFSQMDIDNQDIVLSGLKEGMYEVALVNNGELSFPTKFEVISAKINVEINQGAITVDFSNNNAKPIYIELCNIAGSHLFIAEIDEYCQSFGKQTIPKLTRTEEYYCKVLFQGQYGKIASERFRIQ